jgi:hypothetical protein
MARRRRKGKYTQQGEAALEEIEAHQRSWIVIPLGEAHEEDDMVVVKAPRFQNRAGQGLVSLVGKEQTFNLCLDEFGSEAWRLFDGERTVGEIADHMAKTAEDERAVSLQRLLMFLRDLTRAGVVRVVTLEKLDE